MGGLKKSFRVPKVLLWSKILFVFLKTECYYSRGIVWLLNKIIMNYTHNSYTTNRY